MPTLLCIRNYISKIEARLKLRQLMWLDTKFSVFLDRAAFKGIRVAIIGPADGVLSEIDEISEKDYDIVVRMNRSLQLNHERPDKFKRTDILFHNLNTESGDRSAGAISFDLLHEQGVFLLVYPHSRGGRTSSRFFREVKRINKDSSVRLMMPPHEFYESFKNEISGREPTTGAVAMAFFLDCDLESLGLFGFNFFRTRYTVGYNDAVNDEGSAIEWAKKTGIHDPDLEASAILKRILDARERGILITLGAGMVEALGISYK